MPLGVYDGYVHCSRAGYGRPFAFAAGLPIRAKTVFSRHIRFSDAMQRDVAEHAVRTYRGWIGVHYRCTDLKTDCPLERIAEIVQQSRSQNVYCSPVNPSPSPIAMTSRFSACCARGEDFLHFVTVPTMGSGLGSIWRLGGSILRTATTTVRIP